MKLVLLALALATGVSAPHVVARVPTGDAPGGATAAYAAVWVANDGSGTLARIDPKTNRVTRRLKLRPGLFSVTHGFGALWAVNYKTGMLARVDPRSGCVRSVRVGGVPFDVEAAFGRVWVTAWEAGKLVEVDPRSLRVVRRIAIGPRPTGLHVAGGGLWVGFGRSATEIARLDPTTGQVERIEVGVRAPSWFVAGARGLWIQAADNVLVHIENGQMADRLTLGRTLAQGALAPDGTLWIPDKEQSVVYRVDPRTARVLGSFAAGPGAFLVLRAFGSMWVTSYAGEDVWRYAAMPARPRSPSSASSAE
jgi:streptogramin lyase